MIDTITSEERMRSLGYGKIKPRSVWPTVFRIIGHVLAFAVMAVIAYFSLVIWLAL